MQWAQDRHAIQEGNREAQWQKRQASGRIFHEQQALQQQANPLAMNVVQGLGENKPTTAVDWENMQKKIYGNG